MTPDAPEEGSDRPLAVLFDLDGTLFDHEGAARSALEAWLPALGVEPAPDVIARWFAAEDEILALYRSGAISWREQHRRRLRRVLPDLAPADEEASEAMFAGYRQRYEASWVAYPDVEAAMDATADRGLRTAILTNGATAQQGDKLRRLGVADRFEFVLTAEDLGTGKPDPVAFQAACDRLGLPPARVVHVGDDVALDVEAAAAAGLRTVFVDRDGRRPDVPGVRSLDELGASLDAMLS